MAEKLEAAYEPSIERILEHLAAQNGPLKLAEQQGLIICLTNELGFKRQTLTHSFDVSGLFTITVRLVQEMADEEPVQRLLMIGLLKVITDQFLEDAGAAASAAISEAA